jgi:hypothetical protein
MEMRCKYEDEKGWCTGRLEGFACVGEKCCDHPDFPEKNDECPEEAVNGAYCHRYNKFFCAGRNHCSDHDYFIKMMKMF